jgi:ribosomal subunit interface protein
LFGQEFKPTAAIRQHVERRMAQALEAAARAVTEAVVRLRDLNAGRGGVDKSCRVFVALPGGGSVAVAAVHRDLYAAVDAAAAKLRRAVLRRLRRRRTRRWQFDQRRSTWHAHGVDQS